LVIDPESVISTLTVVSPPPDTITPTHHVLVPLFNPTLMLVAEGAEVGADVAVPEVVPVGLVVGAVEGAAVGAVVGAAVLVPVAEEPDEDEELDAPDSYTAGPGMG
jgi:hypothetical protein